jgi:hypothetical protein
MGGTLAGELKRGDRVEWTYRSGKAVGVVKRKLTARTTVSGQVVAASKDDPRFLVETEKSKKRVAKRPDALKRIS